MKPSSRARVMSAEDLARELDERRSSEGCTVALANGCFDLLHPGHVSFLEGAAKEADLLVVGINADASVEQLKGPGRPVMPADDRACVVAALRVVDYATVFEEPTADRLIETIRPDVHCKGPDYAGGVPEQATADRVGARVALVGGPKIHNTTDILHGIRGDDAGAPQDGSSDDRERGEGDEGDSHRPDDTEGDSHRTDATKGDSRRGGA